MQSELASNWPRIVWIFKKSLFSTGFYTFATTDPEGRAHMAPYASLILKDDCTGYYSEVFPNRMTRNLKEDQRICIMAVSLGRWQWFKALLTGRFDEWPGVRLYGTVGKSRTAQPGELDRFLARVKRYKPFKGYDLLWKDMHTVRDIRFTHFEPLNLGAMTRHLEAIGY